MHPLKLILPFLIFTFSLFAEKVVLISGATSGIGLAAVTAFQEKGWKVWAGHRQNIPDALKQRERVRLIPLDVTNEEEVRSAIQAILKEDGRIDALINNAGYGLIGAEECVTVKEAEELFQVNFFGPLRLTQAVLPAMRQQQSGHIINISSGVGIHSLPGLGLYSASKFALEGLSESLAATLSPWNIKVSIVEPGFVKNPWGSHCQIASRTFGEDFYSRLTKGIADFVGTPKGQPPEEVAELLVAIAESKEPDVRYQTTKEMKAYIGEKLVDPTGNAALKNNIRFIKRLAG